jgi:hypothetical protein
MGSSNPLIGFPIVNRQLTDGWFGIGRRRILHPDTKQLAGFLPLPGRTLTQRMFHPDGAGARAVCNAAAAEPAFIGIQHNGWFAFLWVRDQHVRTAHLDAIQACSAKIGIK